MGAPIACIVIAWGASWRLSITVFCVIVGPALGSLWVLGLIDAPPSSSTGIVLALLLFPLSFFVHELGHAVAYIGFVRRLSDATMRSLGSWRRARLVRDSVGLEQDAIVSLAGPVAGAIMMVPVALCGGSFLIVLPWQLLFLAHLLSLGPWASDGRQVQAYIRERRLRHARGH